MVVEFDAWEVKELAADLVGNASSIESRAEVVVAKTAYAGVAEAKYNAPVDTGFLENSISAEVMGLEAVYGPTASYGIYVELGTSRMAAQPYLGPSVEAITPTFEIAISQLAEEVL